MKRFISSLGVMSILFMGITPLGTAQASALCSDCFTVSVPTVTVKGEVELRLKNFTPNTIPKLTVIKDGWLEIKDQEVEKLKTDSNGSATYKPNLDESGDEGVYTFTADDGKVVASASLTVAPATTDIKDKIKSSIGDFAILALVHGFNAGLGNDTSSDIDQADSVEETMTTYYSVGQKPSFVLETNNPNTNVDYSVIKNGTTFVAFASPGKTDANGKLQVNIHPESFTNSDVGEYLLFVSGGNSFDIQKFVVGASNFNFDKLIINMPKLKISAPYTANIEIPAKDTNDVFLTLSGLPDGLNIDTNKYTGVVEKFDLKISSESDKVEKLSRIKVASQNGKYQIPIQGTPTEKGSLFITVDDGSKVMGVRIAEFALLKEDTTNSNTNTQGLSYDDLKQYNELKQINNQDSTTATQQVPKSYMHVKVAGSKTIWYITPQGKKYPVVSEKIFMSYGNKDFNNVVEISKEELDSYPKTEYIRLKGDLRVYKIEGKYKRLLTPEAALNVGITENDLVIVNKTEFDYFRTGAGIKK